MKTTFSKLLPLFSAVLIGTTHAQMGPPILAGSTEFSSEFVVVSQSDAELEGGTTDMGTNRLGIQLSVMHGLERGRAIGGSLGFTKLDYDFSSDPAANGVEPWSGIEQWSLNLQYRHAIDRESALFVMPGVELSTESGASTGDGFEFGTIAGYTKQFSPTLALGFGGGVFHGMEDTSGFPVIFVYWQINDTWRMSNPFRPGPSGPAGLELVYTGLEGWEIGFGGSYRVDRFALDNTGVAPNGFGENSGAATFVRATKRFDNGGSLDLYFGTIVSGELELEDRNGRGLSTTDYDPTPLLALAFSQSW